MTYGNLLKQSIEEALPCLLTTKHVPKNKSNIFLKAIHESLAKELPKCEVLSRPGGWNKALYLNELMFDIHVCEMGTAKSLGGRMDIEIINKAVIQVECEFNRWTRSIYKDFSKLVAGSAKTKLFIGPYDYLIKSERYQNLGPIAHNCNSEVFLALVPHPDLKRGGEFMFLHYESAAFKVFS
jgi:hypothetical protein